MKLEPLIPPLVLFLIGVGFWLSDRPSADLSENSDSSADLRMNDKELAKRGVGVKDSAGAIIPENTFPLKYLANWKTDEGLMALLQGSESRFIRGFYYDDNGEVRGKVTTTYLNENGKKVLSGYWIQAISMKKCGTEKYGSYYWGRLAFEFKGDSFTGVWGYCDEKAVYAWNGKLA